MKNLFILWVEKVAIYLNANKDMRKGQAYMTALFDSDMILYGIITNKYSECDCFYTDVTRKNLLKYLINKWL